MMGDIATPRIRHEILSDSAERERFNLHRMSELCITQMKMFGLQIYWGVRALWLGLCKLSEPF